MAAILVVSSVNHRRILRARTWLEAKEPAEEVLIVASTLDAANELARCVVKDKSAAFGWHRLTLSQLAAVIARPALAGRGVVPLSPIGTHAITARLVHRLKERDELGRYGGVAGTPEFPLAVARVLTELRLASLSRDKIVDVVPELAPLITGYENELSEAGLTDWPGILELAAEAASKSEHDRLICLPTLLLDVSVGNEAEFRFVRALAEKAPENLATGATGDETCVGRLRRALNPEIEDLDLAAAKTGTLANLQRHLFSDEPVAGPLVEDNAVEVFSAPGEGRECVEIARRVLSRARSGVSFDGIAVFVRSPEVYRANLQEAFNRAGIPAHFVRGAIRPDPAGRALCALLKARPKASQHEVSPNIFHLAKCLTQDLTGSLRTPHPAQTDGRHPTANSRCQPQRTRTTSNRRMFTTLRQPKKGRSKTVSSGLRDDGSVCFSTPR